MLLTFSFFSLNRPQVTPYDRFSRIVYQTIRFHERKCLLGVRISKIHILGVSGPKKRQNFLLNMGISFECLNRNFFKTVIATQNVKIDHLQEIDVCLSESAIIFGLERHLAEEQVRRYLRIAKRQRILRHGALRDKGWSTDCKVVRLSYDRRRYSATD